MYNNHPFRVTLKSDKSYHIKKSQDFLKTNKKEATLLNLDQFFNEELKKKNNFNQKYYF